MIPDSWRDNSTLEGELFEGFIQTVFWTIVLNLIHVQFESYCEGREWYKRVATQKGGTQEFIATARAIPQHLTAGLLAFFGCILGSSRMVRHATLAEFGYETFDIGRMWILYLQNKLDPREANKLIFAVTFHHLPGILAIIPGNLYLSQNIHFQKIAAWLLLPSAFNLMLAVLVKTYDVTDLAERTRFTVAYVIS